MRSGKTIFHFSGIINRHTLSIYLGNRELKIDGFPSDERLSYILKQGVCFKKPSLLDKPILTKTLAWDSWNFLKETFSSD